MEVDVDMMINGGEIQQVAQKKEIDFEYDAQQYLQ